ncbi:MAG: hypothetical protein JOS17DRAFT_731174 [Linnemannia elongata]|nr:MAG: hypothetical protein JOS17DRAFT_731174 [Linnemannia elongata]
MSLLFVARASLFDDLTLLSMSLFLSVDSLVLRYVLTATIHTRRGRVGLGLLFAFLGFFFFLSFFLFFILCICDLYLFCPPSCYLCLPL